MDITSVNRDVPAAPVTASAIPADKSTENREVIQAVKALNSTEMFGQDNELMFQKDQQTKRMVIRVVDRKTNEVITQIPPEYVLRLAASMKQTGS